MRLEIKDDGFYKWLKENHFQIIKDHTGKACLVFKDQVPKIVEDYFNGVLLEAIYLNFLENYKNFGINRCL